MDEKLMYLMIQGQISYEFKNKDLLTQALTRRSYSQENGGLDNEVLEFIGDKVLDIAVVKYLSDKYGSVDNDGFSSQFDEGELTRIKARMVEKKTLARRIDELGFTEFIKMGNGDIENNVNEQQSVKEDLFEAILGAVALDCNWDFNTLFQVVDIMLNPDSFDKSNSEKNYTDRIIELETKKWNVIPLFKYYKRSYQDSLYFQFDGVSQHVQDMNKISDLQYTCLAKLLTDLPEFRGFGRYKNEAREQACKVAYEWLEKEGLLWSIRDEIENPNKDEAINQLEILARRDYFSIPEYEFEETFDKDGNPVWECKCYIDEVEYYFSATSSSKKDAKKSAAFDMLNYVLEEM